MNATYDQIARSAPGKKVPRTPKALGSVHRDLRHQVSCDSGQSVCGANDLQGRWSVDHLNRKLGQHLQPICNLATGITISDGRGPRHNETWPPDSRTPGRIASQNHYTTFGRRTFSSLRPYPREKCHPPRKTAEYPTAGPDGEKGAERETHAFT